MLKQLAFIPFILKGVGQAQHLYAADILLQLYRSKRDMSIKELMEFFRRRNPLLIFETIMTLKDLGYIQPVHLDSEILFKITETGIEKAQMMHACFRL